MIERTKVKICGLSRPDDVAFTVDAGADYVGFVLFPKSPRHVSADGVGELVDAAGPATTVALLVNPKDDEIEAVLEQAAFRMIQLHGDESPERVREVGEKFDVQVMKAVGVRDRRDLDAIEDHSDAADQLLIDAKPVPGAARPGGAGIRFDWSLISNRKWRCPWMLAGGLDSGNVADAIRETGAGQVDVSTGVESAPGRKDKIQDQAIHRRRERSLTCNPNWQTPTGVVRTSGVCSEGSGAASFPRRSCR